MGTDIHARLRVKTYNNEWEYHEVPYEFDCRDYDFFAILANVRNGYGFGRTARYADSKPIKSFTNDRGLPEDLKHHETDVYDDTYGDYGDHSFGYITLAELKRDIKLANQEVIRTGVVPLEIFRALKPGKGPDEWSGWISGNGIKVIDQDSVTDDIATQFPDDRIYVEMQWKDKPFKDKIKSLISWMSHYQTWQDETGDDVQFIFGFDS